MLEETKRKISLARIGRKHSEETLRKMSDARKKYISSDETKQKTSKTLKNRLLNDIELRNKHIKTLLSSGFNTRFQNGFTSWNKGKLATKETRNKMSKSCKGRPSSMKGKHHSQETKDKLRLSHLGKTGRRGDKSHWWRGGLALERRRPGFTKTLKKSIRKRDNFTCQECGYIEEQLGYPLHIHHIDYNKNNHNSENLISLCVSCHGKTNFKDRKQWTGYYNKKMIEREIGRGVLEK
jgi:hypothetical protein